MDKVQVPISPTQKQVEVESIDLPNTAPPVVPVSHVESQLQEERRRSQELQAQIQELEKALKGQQADLKEQMRKEVYEDAFNQGLSDATSEIAEIESVYQQLLSSVNDGFAQLESDVAQLVLASLGKILGQQLVRPEIAVAAVKEVLRNAGHQERMRVHVSPTDHQVLERYRRQISTANNLEFVADDRVTIGGCLVELDRGMLDGRIEIQLQTLVDTLTQVRKPRA